MKFTHAGPSLTKADLDAVERRLGLELPRVLRAQYLRSNGGRPERTLFATKDDEIIVDGFLPLKSRSRNLVTAPEAYRSLQEEKAVGPHLFPFADDVAGDLFLVDTSTPDGKLYFWVHDTARERLRPLRCTIGKFWSRLRKDPEDDE